MSSLAALSSWVREDLARTLALTLAGGFASLAVDSFIAHYVGVAGEHPGQALPVVVGLFSAVAVGLGALGPRGSRARMISLTTGGLVSAVVGLAGAGFHGLVLWEGLAAGPLGWSQLETALFAAPPPLAPLAFVGLGGLAALLASAPTLHGPHGVEHFSRGADLARLR